MFVIGRGTGKGKTTEVIQRALSRADSLVVNAEDTLFMLYSIRMNVLNVNPELAKHVDDVDVYREPDLSKALQLAKLSKKKYIFLDGYQLTEEQMNEIHAFEAANHLVMTVTVQNSRGVPNMDFIYHPKTTIQ